MSSLTDRLERSAFSDGISVSELLLEAKKALEQQSEDSRILDFIDSQPGFKWLARQSSTGRGYRIHQGSDGVYKTAREAILAELTLTGVGVNYSYSRVLTPAQNEYLASLDSLQAEIKQYFLDKVDVNIVLNIDSPHLPPYAIEVDRNPGFWIGCFDSSDEAREVALNVGLNIVGSF